MKSVAWYARRLRVMGLKEIGFRLAEQVAIQSLRWSTPSHDAHADSSFCRASDAQLPALPWAFDATTALRDGLTDGRWPALGFDWRWSSDPDCWHRAPDTGADWPRRFFADIPYRPGNPCGDIRVAWEPARLQQLVGLALLTRHSDGARQLEAVGLLESEFISWLAANPPYEGIHYISAMECALRLIAVCHALDLVRGQLARRDEVWSGLLAMVSSHARLIERRLSRHSSAGNHTIAECAGLVYAGALFPEIAAAGRWKRIGLELLAAEADRQILDDGGGLEQAFWYLLFITDLSGLVCALLRHQGEDPPVRLVAAVERGRDFLAGVAEEDGELPAVGDRDDGYALAPWLRLSRRRDDQPQACRTFARAGYTRIRAPGPPHFDILFDHGPLGMGPLFGHGHADALALIVRINGRAALLDPGTFTYGGDPVWRRHFRATAAHNTISVDGQDQALQEGPFAWSAPYSSRVVRAEESAGQVRVLAQHDGYGRLGGVTHWRGIAVRPGNGLLVWDYLTGGGEHMVQLHWHGIGLIPGPAGQWSLDGDVTLEIRGADVTRELTGGPPTAAGGWLSTQYGTRRSISTVQAERRGALPCELVTCIMPGQSRMRVDFQQELAVFREWLA